MGIEYKSNGNHFRVDKITDRELRVIVKTCKANQKKHKKVKYRIRFVIPHPHQRYGRCKILNREVDFHEKRPPSSEIEQLSESLLSLNII